LFARFAPVFALATGAFLTVDGTLGLIFGGAEFDVGEPLPRHTWNWVFQFNGWHELLHVLTGLLLVVAWSKRAWLPAGLLAFGALYTVFAALAFSDGDDVANVVFSNARDNIVHAYLGVVAIALAVAAARRRPVPA
jgi:hypothetical protein